jgi:transglutaminase-like putative cysteine protease
MATRLYLPSARVYVDRSGSIRLPHTLKPGMVYSVTSRALVPNPSQLRAATGTPPPFIRERYLALPHIPERVHTLARQVTEGQPTAYDRVLAVNRYLWATYRFDLAIPPQRGRGDAVDYFLFEQRRGYCEQFASAMVVMLRSAGIPSRLATGYTPGTLNRVTGLLEVRNSDAHAWVEVFFPGIGWVEFEPTPGFTDTAALGGAVMRRWVWQDLAASLGEGLARLAARTPLLRSAIGAAGAAARGGAWVLVVLLGVGGVAGLWRRLGRPAPASRRGPRVALEEIYAEMCALLARYGLARAASETVTEHRRRVEAARQAPELGAVAALVEAEAYGGRGAGVNEVRVARRQVAALRLRLERGDAHR